MENDPRPSRLSMEGVCVLDPDPSRWVELHSHCDGGPQDIVLEGIVGTSV